MYLTELLWQKASGARVVERWLKRVHITINTFEIKEERSGWVSETLEKLLACSSLEEVSIVITSEDPHDAGLVKRIAEEEVRPVAIRLRAIVKDECVCVLYACQWLGYSNVLASQTLPGPWGRSERANNLFRVIYDRDTADKRRRGMPSDLEESGQDDSSLEENE